MKPTRIIIEVSGGVVQQVYADQPIDVDVLDHDNQEYLAENGGATAAQAAHEKLEQEASNMLGYL